MVKLDMNKALALPTGSVRAIIAIALLILIATLLIKMGSAPEWLCALFLSVVAYYFGFKNGNGKK